jgi:hypothetical protein
MKTIISRLLTCRIWCMFFILPPLITLTEFVVFAQIIPNDRRITWEGNVGVYGDIPTRSIIYTTLSPSGSNDTSAIQSAITACPVGQVVKLNAGTFNISSGVKIKSGVTLRGSGLGVTILKGQAGSFGGSYSYILGFDRAGTDWGSSVTITGGLTKGSTTITTASTHGWSAGDYIMIDQTTHTNGNPPVTAESCSTCGRVSGRPVGQLVKLIAPTSGTTATLEVPTYWNYESGYTPQGTKCLLLTTDAGIEDLTVDNSLSQSAITIFMKSANCWLLRVDSKWSKTRLIQMYFGYRNTIRSCIMREPGATTPSAGYGLSIFPIGTANLVEDNIVYDTGNPIIFEGPTAGNVFAYNYLRGQLNTSNARQNGCIVFHSGHPMMNLFEGNYITQGYVMADYYFGSSSHNTFYRNRNNLNSQYPTPNWSQAFNRDYDFWKSQWYYNLVGNVIGTEGYETTYEVSNTDTGGTSERSIYRLPSNDSSVRSTMLRHRNYDYVSDKVVDCADTGEPGCQGGSGSSTLPDSLYLTSRPVWYGGCMWPPVDPNGPSVEDIPAKLRYEGSSCTTDTNRPSPPQGFGIK